MIDDILNDSFYHAYPKSEKIRKELKLQLFNAVMKEIIGEDCKHHNGQRMKNPSYECPECGEPDLLWSLNIHKQDLRSKARKLFGIEEEK